MEFVAHVRKDGECQSLSDHLEGVAARAAASADKLDLAIGGELLGLLHDLGKYSKEFQNYLKSATGLLNQDIDEEYVDAGSLRGRIDHSTAGAQLIWTELSKRGALGGLVGQIFSLCVASHHSGLIDCLTPEGEDAFGRRMRKNSERTFFSEVLAAVDPKIIGHARALLKKTQLIENLQTRLAKIALAGSAVGEGVPIQQQIGLLVRFLFSCLIDADRVDTANFEKPRAARNRMCGCYEDWSILVGRLSLPARCLVARC